MATKVTAWKDINGQLHEKQTDAINVDQSINRVKRVAEIIDDFHFNGITSSELVEDIITRREELLEALK